MSGKIFNVLVFCTGNSARSIMTEALFNKVFRQIKARVSQFVNLPLHVLDRSTIEKEMRAIGEEPLEAQE